VGALLAGFALVAPVFMFPFQPLASLMARKQEFEADAFAAAHASADSLASALAKLYRDNAATLTPDPLHSLVYDSHPPATLRIDHLRAVRRADAP
jgi:STE24 endopeptidase